VNKNTKIMEIYTFLIQL